MINWKAIDNLVPKGESIPVWSVDPRTGAKVCHDRRTGKELQRVSAPTLPNGQPIPVFIKLPIKLLKRKKDSDGTWYPVGTTQGFSVEMTPAGGFWLRTPDEMDTHKWVRGVDWEFV